MSNINDFEIDGWLSVKGYTGNDPNVEIPERAMRIGRSAFEDNTNIKSVTIPENVFTIESNAFSGCTSLTQINLSEGLDTIESSAFKKCPGLKNIFIPGSVTDIWLGAFGKCSGLENISVSRNNKVYHSANNCLINAEEKMLIAGCKNSKIPNDGSVKKIDDYAFEGCEGLKSITIPDGVTSIGDSVFDGCVGLTNINIADSVRSLGDYVFSGCTNLTKITIPYGVRSIGKSAFWSCKNLVEITIPETVTEIGEDAFWWCNRLVIKCAKDSFAFKYAEENEIETEELSASLTNNNISIKSEDATIQVNTESYRTEKHKYNAKINKGIHYVSNKPERVIVGNLFSIEIPVGFSYSIDPDVNTQNVASGVTHLLQAHKGEDYDFSNAYAAEINIVVFGQWQLAFNFEIGANSDGKMDFLNSYTSRIDPRMKIVKETEDVVVSADLTASDESSAFSIMLGPNNFLLTGQILADFDEMGRDKAREFLLDVYNSIEAVGYDELCDCSELVRLPEKYELDFSESNYFEYDDNIRVPIPKGFKAFTDVSHYSFGVTIAPEDYSTDTNPLDALMIFNIAVPDIDLTKLSIEVDLTDEDFISKTIDYIVTHIPNYKNTIQFHTAKYNESGIIVTWLSTNTPCTAQICNTIIISKTKVYLCNFAIKYDSPISDEPDTRWDANRITMSYLSRILFEGESVEDLSSKAKNLSFTKAKPKEELYPHYHHLGDTSTPKDGGGFIIVTNSGGTEYKFYHLSKADEDDETSSADYDEICAADTGYYNLDETAERIQKLFHVSSAAFDYKHDRENEIAQCMIRKAYMMSALRSFTWTVLDYCEKNNLDVDDLSVEELESVLGFIKKREWLNYNDNGLCDGLCGVQDLHVFYIPNSVPQSLRKPLLPDEEDLEEYKKMKETFPSYNAILNGIGSLDDLRDDLEKIEPAIVTLADSLSENRDYNEELTGGAADVVYAWCSLALAAKEPFFSEDGPMTCWFSPIETTEEKEKREAAEEAVREKEREEAAAQHEKEWLDEYEEYLEINPNISFDNTIFVFTGLGGKGSEKEHPLVQKVIEEGGQYRTTVSGKTDYLVVDPKYAGSSKVDKAIEIQENSGKVQIIRRSDLEEVLGFDSSDYETSYSVSSSVSVLKPYLKIKDDSSEASKIKETSEKTEDSPLLKTNSSFSDKKQDDIIIVSQKEIDDGVFKERKDIFNISFAPDVTCIKENAFYHCSELKSVIIPNNVKAIESFAFFYCSNLETITFGKGIKEISSLAFSGCNNIKSIEFPDDVWNICNHVFADYDVIKRIKEEAVSANRMIADEAYKDRKDITSFKIPDGTEIIGDCAFLNCTKLTEVEIPDSVKFIGEAAFCGCEELESISIPDSVVSIGNEVFFDCPKLKAITIPENVRYIGPDLLTGCSGLVELTVSERNPAYHSHGNCLIDTECKKIIASGRDCVIPTDGRVTSIEFNSINSCSDVFIPSCINNIESGGAFSGCKELESISVSEENPVYHSKDNCVIETGKEELIVGCKNSIIPSDGSVKRIGDSAFAFRTSITYLVIPECVTEIGPWAFDNCSGLVKIFIPSGITNIGDMSFFGCKNLSDIYYGGSEKDRESIKIGKDNEPLNSAKWHYNCDSSSLSADSGNNKSAVKAELGIDSADTPDTNFAEDEKAQTYKSALALMNSTDSDNWRLAEDLFRSIEEYKDSSELKNQCKQKIERQKNEVIYKSALELMNSADAKNARSAERLFRSINGFKNSAELAEQCGKKADEAEKAEKHEKEKKEIELAERTKRKAEYESLKREKNELLKTIEENKGSLFGEKAKMKKKAKKRLEEVESALLKFDDMKD